ncbi:RrF2 family transcriptional regulator [Galbibacter sp.]|jgi:Rrf2 family protein|uniref:RrF2 family transcriptional regulator n=1 Tax=Galbibacter sp. TaxID=2918471 RepID=UPI003A91653C
MLSKKTKYGLKALTYMARKESKNPVLISEIAEEENISKKFLEIILLQLKNSGFLGSKKGKGGGYYLIREPENISVAALIRILEGPIAMLPCVSLNFYEKCDDCKDEKTCSISMLMMEVRDSTLKILENKTLRDLTNTTLPLP